MKVVTDDEIRNRRLEKLRFWRRACADQAEKWTCYNSNDRDAPLIFFHGDTDMGGIYVRRLAAECEYPIAALAPPGLHSRDLHPSVEHLTTRAVSEILAFKPGGPFRIGGYCNGAVLAYECAHRLRELGHEIEIIIMIEPPSINTRPVFRAVQRLLAAALPPAEQRSLFIQQRFGDVMHVVWNIGRLLHLSPAQICNILVSIWRRWGVQRHRVSGGESAATASERQVRDIDAAFKRFHWRSVSTYLPRPTTIPVVALSTGFDGGGRRCGMYDGTQWVRMARNFRHIKLPGHHSTCLSTHVGELGAELKRVLHKLPYTQSIQHVQGADKSLASDALLSVSHRA